MFELQHKSKKKIVKHDLLEIKRSTSQCALVQTLSDILYNNK